MKTVALHTLGCKLNFSETSSVGRQFLDQGFERVEFTEKADVYVINTCSVTDNADKKCRNIVSKALRLNPEAYVIVMGCYAQLKPKEIAGIPGVDLVLGAKEKFRLFEIINTFDKTPSCTVAAGEIGEVTDFVNSFSLGDRTRSFLKIQDGCDYKCTFCTIPLARGKSRSDSLENILKNAREIAQAGVKEIVLTGVNIGDYGTNQPENFLDVIQALDEVEGIDRYRISSIEPNLLSDEIIAFVGRSQHFMPHFHVPLQSGNNELLGKMRRRYKRELYASRVQKIKEIMPHACIGVDVIVGFPGETDAHFMDTYEFLNQLDVSYLHVFTYSERSNTVAAEMEGRVPSQVRAERSNMLRILSEKKRRHFYEQFQGASRPVLFEGEAKDGFLQGFTDNYIRISTHYDPELINQIEPCLLTGFDENGNMTVEFTHSPVRI
ncbi:MAG: tRNA (N(6)-L-threonylcarbamoyladenosine(37)-C(2))-methylthiotransferase MtaB [Bacteroidia bacterium]|nr:tRNA (N(6)-L-threonylcarbamoyladenosine(37)-C(2))-methylthiotransferase MtaB [Bacteroidia bacterium]